MTGYKISNEKLESIVFGLDVCNRDCILAIGGSGDQAFALIEHKAEVLAVDEDPAQIVYMNENIELIRRGEFREFFKRRLENFPCKNSKSNQTLHGYLQLEQIYGTEYFTLNKLKRIQSNMDKLKTEYGNIFNITELSRFNKIYLSNSLSYFGSDKQCRNSLTIPQKLKKMENLLPVNGLIYIAGKTGIEEHARKTNLKIDKILTKRAEKCSWSPVVLRKYQKQ